MGLMRVRLKSDQDGIESNNPKIRTKTKRRLKSDQDGIESFLS